MIHDRAPVADAVEGTAGNRSFAGSAGTGHGNDCVRGRQSFLETRDSLRGPGRDEHTIPRRERSKGTLFQAEMLLVHSHHWQFGAKQPQIQGVKSQKAVFYVTSSRIEQIAAF